jgi:hypothetical protein
MYGSFGYGPPPWMRHRRGHRRCGGGPGRYPNREEWLRGLEEYQKDLEQEVADIADLIRRLKEEEPSEPSEPETASA